MRRGQKAAHGAVLSSRSDDGGIMITTAWRVLPSFDRGVFCFLYKYPVGVLGGRGVEKGDVFLNAKARESSTAITDLPTFISGVTAFYIPKFFGRYKHASNSCTAEYLNKCVAVA